MCGRFTLSWPAPRLAQLFDAREAPGLAETYQPSFNLAPTRFVAGLVMPADGERLLQAYRWGLVPPWASDPSIGNRLFNARAETLDTRKAFADAVKARRVAILADGFYEWRNHQPFFFHRADGTPLLFAGLWEAWHPPHSLNSPHPDHDRLLSCTIITTAAGEDMDGIHDRMPVVLAPERLDTWLGRGRLNGLEREELFGPAPRGTLVHHPVDPRVGDVRQDDADLVVPYSSSDPEPRRLFN